MMNFIPIFPLTLVAFPGERLNLHIFEPRYKQLVADCRETGKPFGIPSVVDNRIGERGTLMALQEVVKTYDNGEMDITTLGLRPFRILEQLPPAPGKGYAGAIVDYPADSDDGDPGQMDRLRDAVARLHRHLDVRKTLRPGPAGWRSFDLAHHAGLTLAQEYELLGIPSERQRQEYLRRHLQTVLPVMAEMEALKEKIRLNGHFRQLPGFEPLP